MVVNLLGLQSIDSELNNGHCSAHHLVTDGYYMTYKPIILSCILFMFIEMNFIHYHSCVMFVIKSMSMCND